MNHQHCETKWLSFLSEFSARFQLNIWFRIVFVFRFYFAVDGEQKA